MFYEIVRRVLRPLCYILFWPVIAGRENIPATGPVILAGNHLGSGETFLLVAMQDRHATFPVKRELFTSKTPWHRLFGWILKSLGQVPMDRTGGRDSVDALASMRDVLAAGGLVAILPEGHRSPDGRLYRGRTGVARLALSTDALVVPFGCFRTRFVWRWLPFPWLFRPEIRIGEGFHFPEEVRRAFLDAPGRDEAAVVLREATDEVMRHVQAITGQEMVDEFSYHPRRAPHHGHSGPA